MVFLIMISVLAPVISPYDPEVINAEHIFTPPGGSLLLGGDQMGRDVLSRIFTVAESLCLWVWSVWESVSQ
jgi:peptide/nickel transport system permease protein